VEELEVAGGGELRHLDVEGVGELAGLARAAEPGGVEDLGALPAALAPADLVDEAGRAVLDVDAHRVSVPLRRRGW
jgi:hypothetical protein